MKHSMKTLMVAAAVSGLLSGAATLQAATPRTTNPVLKAGKASFSSASLNQDTSKHSCKGKNSCKGKGGCATDGSMDKKK